MFIYITYLICIPLQFLQTASLIRAIRELGNWDTRFCTVRLISASVGLEGGFSLLTVPSIPSNSGVTLQSLALVMEWREVAHLCLSRSVGHVRGSGAGLPVCFQCLCGARALPLMPGDRLSHGQRRWALKVSERDAD